MICPNCNHSHKPVTEDLRCIDCQAKAAGKRDWTDAEEALIEQYYGAVKPAELQRRILKATGSPRSRNAVIVHAGHMNLDYRTNQDGITIADAARELGLGRHHIDRLVRSGLIKSFGRGKVRLMPLAALARIREIYPPLPARALTKTQAMRKMGYCESHFTRLLIAGAIRGVRHGERWYVDADHIDEMVAEMKKSGDTRRQWKDVPHLEAERARARLYSRTRRKELRAEARTTTWCTFTEAERLLGTTRDSLRRALENGLIRGRRENDLWLVERAHVLELAGQEVTA